MIITAVGIIFISALFEVSFVEIRILQNISFLFIAINILFWLKKYRLAFVCGIITSLLIDLILQLQLGRNLLSLFLPLLILDFFNGLLKVESKVSRVVFSILGVVCSIFISDLLFELVFITGNFELSSLLSKTLVSTIVTVIVGFVLNASWIPDSRKEAGFSLK
ncbi:MAG: hypothetical protein PHS44_05815 [Candidatus Dojkabacteria bacterium]|nr:hypothetical protein [Candidatus Dojkabacteria bacterium]